MILPARWTPSRLVTGLLILSGINRQLVAGGGVATIVGGNTENLQAQLLGSPYLTNSKAVLYTSFTVAMDPSQLPTTNGSSFIMLNDGSGNTADIEDCVVAATNGAAPGDYRLGIANFGGDATGAQMVPVDLTPGTTYFVVTSLTLSNGVSTIWVSPTNQASAHSTDLTPPGSSTNFYDMSDIELRESGTTEGKLAVGNVLVGTTFSSVFYPPQCSTPSAWARQKTSPRRSARCLMMVGRP